jgi:hypothetical protein
MDLISTELPVIRMKYFQRFPKFLRYILQIMPSNWRAVFFQLFIFIVHEAERIFII